MTKQKIEPSQVTKPIQLLAAWLVALILVDASFLTAASYLESPSWLSATLVIASIANVPLFIFSMFLLQTKYRVELQEDYYYSQYLQEQNRLNELGNELATSLESAGFDFRNLASGRSLDDVPDDSREKINDLLSEMKDALHRLEAHQGSTVVEVKPEIALKYAKALMAQGKWTEAAKQFDEYVKHCPSDWEAHFFRGLSYHNSRQGDWTNLSAVRAYNEAIAFAPSDLDNNFRARLFAYKGAVLKRLRRLDEAESVLLLAQKYATGSYEVNDIKYNLAAVYAMKGEREKMLEMVRSLANRPENLRSIRAHLSDYFANFVQDDEFLKAIRY